MGKTPVKMSSSEDYQKIIRFIHLHGGGVNRLGVSICMGVPFGTSSRIISELVNEGYLRPAPLPRHVISRASINYELFRINTADKGKHLNWNYGSAPVGRARVYMHSMRWVEFMQRYDRFLRTGKDPGRRYRG